MDSKFNGCLMHYVLFLMLLGNHWSLALPAPTEHKCSFKMTVDLTNLLVHEAKDTLQKYKKNNSCNPQIPDEVPSATVAGFNRIEKLQDIYARAELFSLHLSQVEIYQKSLFKTDSDMESVLKSLSDLKTRLNNLLETVKCHIQTMDPSASVPASPPAPNLRHHYSYEKKVYGCGVIVRLRDWGQNVRGELESMSSSNVARLRR
ncbi:uncharacterized protein LOC122828739 [Gambusia affinis]|uniref:uncharacterized protein LOC122828739 n=1 Tax=Gambusia affinis TaxID=33528 RepID=UPI001CDD084B|nr:uncharacterized protein LOC122828739 [Gambusia affinis]